MMSMIFAALFFASGLPMTPHEWTWTDCLPPTLQLPTLYMVMAGCYAMGFIARTFPPRFQQKSMVMLYVLGIALVGTVGLMVPQAENHEQALIYAVFTGVITAALSTFSYDLFVKAIGQKIAAVISALAGSSSVKEPVEPDPQNQPNKKDPTP